MAHILRWHSVADKSLSLIISLVIQAIKHRDVSRVLSGTHKHPVSITQALYHTKIFIHTIAQNQREFS